jgi:hypothetical protein
MDDESHPQPADPGDSDRLGDLFALGAILDAALKDTDYQLTEAASAALHLSNYGEDIYNLLKKKLYNTDDGLLKLALLCENYWKEMFFDDKSDTHVISLDISNGLIKNHIRLPF